MQTPSFIKVKDDSLLFSQEGCLKFFIPQKLFDNKVCELSGEYVYLFGIFTYALYDKNDKPIGGLRNFNFPTTFISKPDDIEMVKGLKLTKNSKEEDYKVLKYHKDGVVVVSYNIPNDATCLDKWYKLLEYGNIPNTIPYNKLQEYFLDNIILSGNGYNVSLQIMGVVISELARSSNDLNKPFRLSKNNDMHAYNMVNIRDIPQISSPFTALTSERWDDAVISSITNKNDKESPIEKIMMD